MTFLGAPSLTQDDVGLGTDGDDADSFAEEDPNDDASTDPSSALAAFTTMTPLAHELDQEEDSDTVVATYQDDLWVQAMGASATKVIPNAAATDTDNRVFVIAEIRDAKGQLLTGGSNVDSAVTFNVAFHADADLKSVARVNYSDTKDVNAMGRAYIELSGWATNPDPSKAGPVKVTVTASYTGPSGNLDLGKVDLARLGSPTGLEAGTHICVELDDDDKLKANDGCPTAMADDPGTTQTDESVEDTKPMMEMVFGQGDTIVVTAKLTDMLGSDTKKASFVSLSSAAKRVLTKEGNAYGASARYEVQEDAELGEYVDGIVVSYGRGDDKLEQEADLHRFG